ncbi:DUF4143 domain-containing protein [Candidatus Dojkabacteria bacterium]|nr:DUF4143 domain-containing protein [Candidatus Dojkabacteria bacterium]
MIRAMQYINRSIKKRVDELKRGFPVIVLTGPRQSGKTTFLKHYLPDYTYFNLEFPNTLEMIRTDPVKFLKNNPKNIIIDEVQRFPELLSYIQVHVDERQEMGSIFLSGSQNLLVSEKISQSLAGRAAYQTLLSFSKNELSKSKIELDQDNFILKGGYPALYVRELNQGDYFQQYISTYLERDVRAIKAVQDLLLFQKFMGLLAGRVGQLVSESSLANDVGVSPNTISSWISILEASYIIYRLQPYYKNQSKRLIKSPKIYFNDTGLLCNLLKIDSVDELKLHYAYGSIFENLVINEFRKFQLSKSISDQLYFYRDSNHNEIDLLIDKGLSTIPIEIKSAQTYDSDFSKGLRYWRQNIDSTVGGYVVYSGADTQDIKEDKLVSWLHMEGYLPKLLKEGL